MKEALRFANAAPLLPVLLVACNTDSVVIRREGSKYFHFTVLGKHLYGRLPEIK